MIESHFAILDVKEGRDQLVEHLQQQQATPIPVVILGYIDGINSKDDGVSREFTVQVKETLTL